MGKESSSGETQGFAVRLEAADDQAADFLLEIRIAIGIAQHRQVRVHAIDLLGHDIEVLGPSAAER